MKLTPIPYNQGTIWIDNTRTARLEEYSLTMTGVVMQVTDDKIILWSDGCYPIVAQSTNLSIPGVPYVEIEEDLDQLAEKAVGGLNSRTMMGDDAVRLHKNCWIKGYKAALAKKDL